MKNEIIVLFVGLESLNWTTIEICIIIVYVIVFVFLDATSFTCVFFFLFFFYHPLCAIAIVVNFAVNGIRR